MQGSGEPAWARHLPAGMGAEDVHLLAEGTLPDAWVRRWAERPDAPVVHTAETGWVTAEGLRRRVAGARATLRAAGLIAGDRIVVSSTARVELIAMHAAALSAGLVVVPANTAYTPPELAHVVSDSGAAGVVVEEPARADDLEATLIPIAGSAPETDDSVDVHAGLGADDPALLAYTSGTTGRPKGAVLSHGNLLASAEAVRLAWRWTNADRLVLALPLFHMHGLGVGVHGTLLTGGSMVLLPRFDADLVLDAAAAHHATMFFGVPTMYARLAISPRVGELAGLRLCVSGSAPLAADLHATIAARSGQRVLERYGMTETCMNVSNPYDGERRPGTVGLPLPGVELRLSAADDEIQLRGPNVFTGYWRNDEATAASFVDGWFRTGDVGRVDGDGYISIVGRTKELIITGGYNVYPREVEEALLRHPSVREAAVIGTPDPEWGEVVTAFVVADTPIEPDELRSCCAESLAPYKQPRLFRFVDTLPRNAMGKIDRRRLAEGA